MENNPVINKYIDPMVDYGFKKIFKESGKKQLIIRPLNAIFGLEITDIEIRDSEQLGLTDRERKATFDMHCTTGDGKKFIIEVQLADQPFFMERADPRQFIHKFMLREGQTSELMSERLRYAFLEVSRFDKPKEACNTFEERFLYLMKNLPTFAEEPELWDDPYFNEMMEEAEYAKMTMEQRYQYAMSMKQKWDLANQITFAEEEKAKRMARHMLKDKLPIESIAKYTELSIEQVRALQEEA